MTISFLLIACDRATFSIVKILMIKRIFWHNYDTDDILFQISNLNALENIEIYI